MENKFIKEWIETNGIGGYASSTIPCANTRRYHGLLVAALQPPVEREILVSKIEERVFFKEQYFDLSTNQYPEKIYPEGEKLLKNFEPKPIPNWTYGTADWELEKSILMIQDQNTTLVQYKNKSSKALIIELHPLFSYTGYHSVFKEQERFDFYTEMGKNEMKIYPTYGSIPIYVKWSDGIFSEARNWYHSILLPREASRGLDFIADYYRIGYLQYELQPEEEVTVLFSTENEAKKNTLNTTFSQEKEKRKQENFSKKTSVFYKDLLQSGQQFLVHRESTDSLSIIAGYHWFSDWGRDTMIAMRGLTIATGNKKASQSILNTFFSSISNGMIPNRFPDHVGDQVAYNTIDATLWLFIAVYEYYQKFKDQQFIKSNLQVLEDILDWHIKGTRYDIYVTPEGFLYGGQEGVQLTWMDAKVNEKVVTPRIGCPIEVNALWYNALKIYQEFCVLLDITFKDSFAQVLSNFEANFTTFFINEEGTLYDVIVPTVSSDASFRCNQIYCVSLPFTLLFKKQQKIIFEAVKDKLYTPYGLRTLSKEDPAFEGEYIGDQWQRDHAYHQGTVWPFLLLEYHTAFLKIYGDSLDNKKKIIAELATLKTHFYQNSGVHSISEVFDGLLPKEGKGCIQQAWSVAALIKLYTDHHLYEYDS